MEILFCQGACIPHKKSAFQPAWKSMHNLLGQQILEIACLGAVCGRSVAKKEASLWNGIRHSCGEGLGWALLWNEVWRALIQASTIYSNGQKLSTIICSATWRFHRPKDSIW